MDHIRVYARVRRVQLGKCSSKFMLLLIDKAIMLEGQLTKLFYWESFATKQYIIGCQWFRQIRGDDNHTLLLLQLGFLHGGGTCYIFPRTTTRILIHDRECSDFQWNEKDCRFLCVFSQKYVCIWMYEKCIYIFVYIYVYICIYNFLCKTFTFFAGASHLFGLRLRYDLLIKPFPVCWQHSIDGFKRSTQTS